MNPFFSAVVLAGIGLTGCGKSHDVMDEEPSDATAKTDVQTEDAAIADAIIEDAAVADAHRPDPFQDAAPDACPEWRSPDGKCLPWIR